MERPIHARLEFLEKRPQKLHIEPPCAAVALGLKPEQQEELDVLIAWEAGRCQGLHC